MKPKKDILPGELLTVDVEQIWVTMEATLTANLKLEWILDMQDKRKMYLGMIVLVSNGKRMLIADKLPEEACQNLFNSICDAYEARGQKPLITFCSFD